MVNYQPAVSPDRPKQHTVLSAITYHVKLAYFRYEILTGQYIMSAGEKTAYNLINLSLLALCLAAVVYLPGSLYLGCQRLAYYLTGSEEIRIPHVLLRSIPEVASLLSTGPAGNASIAL